MAKEFPVWLDRTPGVLLREVAPGLYVGGAAAVTAMAWGCVVDLCGSSSSLASTVYGRVPVLLRWDFPDGEEVPEGLVEVVSPLVGSVDGPVLIHCRVGLSRSPSVAYAVLRTRYGLSDNSASNRIYVEPGWPARRTIESVRSRFRR